MNNKGQICIKLIHCGNVNITNPNDQGQKNIFFMPMGFFPLGNALKENGFDVEIIHLDLECSNKMTEILDFETVDLIGFDCHWVNQSLVVMDTAKLIKEIKPEIFIFLGGFTASLFAEEIVTNYFQVDAVLRGDGDIPIIELCRAVQEKKINSKSDLMRKVQNLVWKEKTEIKVNGFTYVGMAQDMEKLDFAAIDLLRNWKSYRELSRFYSHVEPINSKPMFLLEIGRGCGYACTFCGGNCEAQRRMNNRKNISVRTISSVVDTIKKAVNFGFETIYTCFEFERSDCWYIDLLNMMKREKINVNYGYGCWSIPSKEFIDALSETCNQVVIEISPETGVEEIRRLNKDIRLFYSNKELEECLDYISTKQNVKVQLFFGYYLVNDTKESILNTISYILKLIIKYPDILEIEYANFSTDPGSLIFFYPDKFNTTIKVRNFNDYLENLKENYVEKKGQTADLILFRLKNISEKDACEIDIKVKLLNYIFSYYRNSISYMLMETNSEDIVMKILIENDLQLDKKMNFSNESVKKVLLETCKKYNILSDYILKTILFEYEEFEHKYRISKPTTQLYLVNENMKKYLGYSPIDRNLNSTDVDLENEQFIEFEF